MSEAMKYGLCLESGEFVPADELNALPIGTPFPASSSVVQQDQQTKPQPLSDEQIERCRQAGYSHEGLRAEFSFEKAARAIEAAACDDRDARIAELEREIAEVRKDAERYRWLAWISDTQPIVIFEIGTGQIMFGNKANDTIDAAMKKE